MAARPAQDTGFSVGLPPSLSTNLSSGQPFGEPAAQGRAAEIVRGVMRLLSDLAFSPLVEVTLANGRRADVMGLDASGEIVIVEVKSCLTDFASDQKWPEYRPYCDRFYFAVDCDFPKERIPEDTGLIVADGFGGAVIREAAADRLPAARRKAVVLGFGRLAAMRLHRLRELSGEAVPVAGETPVG